MSMDPRSIALNTASVSELLAKYGRSYCAARRFAVSLPDESNAHREIAEAIAAEIERRCVR